MTKHDFLHVMHELTRVLQNGLNLHRREPGAKMAWARYYVNQPALENGRCSMCLPRHVKPSWHLTWHNVGILMATREQYANAMASRRRLDLERMLFLFRRRGRAIFLFRWCWGMTCDYKNALHCSTHIHHRLLRSKMLVLENNVLNCIECVGPCLT